MCVVMKLVEFWKNKSGGCGGEFGRVLRVGPWSCVTKDKVARITREEGRKWEERKKRRIADD